VQNPEEEQSEDWNSDEEEGDAGFFLRDQTDEPVKHSPKQSGDVELRNKVVPPAHDGRSDNRNQHYDKEEARRDERVGRVASGDEQGDHWPVDVDEGEAVGEGEEGVDPVVLWREVCDEEHREWVHNGQKQCQTRYSYDLVADLATQTHDRSTAHLREAEQVAETEGED